MRIPALVLWIPFCTRWVVVSQLSLYHVASYLTVFISWYGWSPRPRFTGLCRSLALVFLDSVRGSALSNCDFPYFIFCRDNDDIVSANLSYGALGSLRADVAIL